MSNSLYQVTLTNNNGSFDGKFAHITPYNSKYNNNGFVFVGTSDNDEEYLYGYCMPREYIFLYVNGKLQDTFKWNASMSTIPREAFVSTKSNKILLLSHMNKNSKCWNGEDTTTKIEDIMNKFRDHKKKDESFEETFNKFLFKSSLLSLGDNAMNDNIEREEAYFY